VSDNLSIFVGIFAFVGVYALCWWLGTLIGKAALLRGCGYGEWVVASLIVGPLIVWIVYLLFVHWKPINFGTPYQEDSESSPEENE